MKTPKKSFAQILGFGWRLTYTQLVRHFNKAREMGYVGITLVAALLPDTITPDVLVEIATRTKMQVIICGFNSGDGPDPFEQPDDVKYNLRKTGRYTVALANAGKGPRLMVGPTHTWHCHERPDWDQRKFEIWTRHLNDLADDLGIQIACEPLNKIEDGTPDAFNTIATAVAHLPHVGIHADTGHIYMLYGDDWQALLEAAASKIWYFELVNVRRAPCDLALGIDFLAYREFMRDKLSDECLVGVEPFAESVVVKFNLTSICQRRVSGIKCLERDMAYFVGLGVFQKAA